MRIVFMGTPQFAADVLEELAMRHDVVAVYTQPDAVRGRGKQLEPSPVKVVAQENGIEVRTPKTLRTAEEQAALAALEPEAICVAAYGAILPAEVLAIPKYGCLNVHASLLPRWRGAAPIERAILAGDEQVGVCIMRMEEGLDTGAYCAYRAIDAEGKTAAQIFDELASLGTRALLTALVHIEEGCAEWVLQDEAQVTYAHKLEKGELNPRITDTAETVVRKVLASGDAHPARCVLAGRGVTLLAVSVAAGDLAANLSAGALRFAGKRLFMGCADGAIEIKEVKPDGKKAMDAKAFAAGMPGLREADAQWTESE